MHLQAYSRDAQLLSGTWSVVPDPYDQFGDSGAFGGDRIFDPEFDTGEPEDADLDDGYDVAVPGCWNEELPAFEHYEGRMWYARRVSWDGRADRAFLRFGAVNYRADVWLNGESLGHHEGGFTPFAVEVTDQLEVREDNLLVVKVDNRRDRRKLPAERTDWFTFGGITRDVELVTVPETFLRNVKVETEIDGDEVAITVRAWTDGPGLAGDEQPRTSIPELDATLDLDPAGSWEESPHEGVDQVSSGDVYEGTATVPLESVDLWTPENPRLYDLRVETGDGDRLRERVGLRTVSVEGSDVLVNGKSVTLRGIALHEEADGRGRSLTPEDREERFDWLADLGCNFARFAHYPHDEAMVRLADEEGILLWSEVPAYWSVAFGDEATQANYRQQLREMVQRDWNRPSVAMWGIANETDHDDDTRNEVLPEMAGLVRNMDPSRLVTAACFVETTDDDTYVVSDPLADHLDVFGVNQYQGWYTGEPDDFRKFESDPSGPPVVISEFGAGAKRGHHGPTGEMWTEEYQAHIFREQLAALDGVEQCCGLSPWLLFDFRSPRRQNPYQRGYNLKGLLDETGQKKLAFDVVRRYYEQDRE